jgi:hypothetical protein
VYCKKQLEMQLREHLFATRLNCLLKQKGQNLTTHMGCWAILETLIIKLHNNEFIKKNGLMGIVTDLINEQTKRDQSIAFQVLFGNHAQFKSFQQSAN